MTRKEMLKQLSELPHPITVGLVVVDDGCQFSILTNNEGFACTVGGAFRSTSHSDEMTVLRAMLDSYFFIFVVRRVYKGRGILLYNFRKAKSYS